MTDIQTGPDEILIDGERWIRGTRHDARVTELLTANNVEVERRRAAEERRRAAEWQAARVVVDLNRVRQDFNRAIDKTLAHPHDGLAWLRAWSQGDEPQDDDQ